MKKEEILFLLENLDEGIVNDFRVESRERAIRFYNQLILEGYDADQATIEVINATAGQTLKYAIAISLAMQNGIDPDDITTKLRRIK
ncbi:hypothetical protein LJK88_38465 [Paenibacillus sp. P26]|nr:hypothetical protein LJK88_38465 [Paenibacillus sp. P26]UUZ93185.1 hypothetical protein LJK87_49825 [Paenibacillus sp. P25]